MFHCIFLSTQFSQILSIFARAMGSGCVLVSGRGISGPVYHPEPETLDTPTPEPEVT